ncbi:hypothetical protein RRG08_021133 [Elysia crispata]|uniref:Uncharacterized protein n=1 Tax=Elysia crispata TaxID=231223 RepID=A0AAE0Z5X0_9GAST|nr:hypothetical protein RRG08_021133 [Elysia crispata]
MSSDSELGEITLDYRTMANCSVLIYGKQCGASWHHQECDCSPEIDALCFMAFCPYFIFCSGTRPDNRPA